MTTTNARIPWTDWEGNPIYEGDILVHPTGERGVVVWSGVDGSHPTDAWKVDYGDGSTPSRLCLQVGGKGRGVVDLRQRKLSSDRSNFPVCPLGGGCYGARLEERTEVRAKGLLTHALVRISERTFAGAPGRVYDQGGDFVMVDFTSGETWGFCRYCCWKWVRDPATREGATDDD